MEWFLGKNAEREADKSKILLSFRVPDNDPPDDDDADAVGQ